MALIALLPGDGIGPEVITQARRVLDALDLDLRYEEAPVGGVAYHSVGHPLPEATLDVARRADASKASARCAPNRRFSDCASISRSSPTCARRRCSRGLRTPRR
jgi:isocitrate/isopropylmalate dehydrogenase